MKATSHPCGATRMRDDRVKDSCHENRLRDSCTGYQNRPGTGAKKANGFEK
ncbi:msr5103 [Mesorhizobium japonicum MAFF 303099]|uniref:Msr5103 protein n=1 Tax=Mesorhizobium japonicum (strain LMG 29417 / CECT 9101 / MAFF 303099) TaxID=266835 RepID=Q98CL1_RHILO|nr:msr5103 [Mesorhizobium japonicum MAFF 303099]